MNLVGNARGGAADQARHLLKQENDHVEVLELRGFASDHLTGALNEIYAVSRGTKCRRFLYSLSVNPPPKEQVETGDLIDAADRVERKLGLENQPRALVLHEKNGRRHLHAVFSRIDTVEMKAIQLFYDRRKLMAVARELFIEHGWTMPRGLSNSEDRDPRNFDLMAWQQAKRVGKDPRAIKTAFQDAWAVSDSKTAFIYAMQNFGFKVARGDRTAFVGVDVHGEAYSIPRQIPHVNTKMLRARLGDEKQLPSVLEAKKQVADEMLNKFDDFQRVVERQNQNIRRELEMRRIKMVRRQRAERDALREKIGGRRIEEARHRQSRFRKGLAGMWDRLRGEHRRIQRENQRDAEQALKRDTQEKEALISRHLTARQNLNLVRLEAIQGMKTRSRELQNDRQMFRGMRLAKDTTPKRTPRSRRIRGPTPER